MPPSGGFFMPHPVSDRLIHKMRKRFVEEINKQPLASIRKLAQYLIDEEISPYAYTTTRQLLTTYKKELERAKEHSALNEYCKDNGIPVESVGNYWHKGKHFSVHVKQNENDIEELARSVIAELDEYVVQYPHIRRKPVKEPHLLVIDPADIHIGKLASSFETGEDYDSQIAVKRVKEGIQGILNKSKGFNIDKILFVAGNDVLHVDTPKGGTTAGTPQDTSGMWYDNFLTAKQLYVECIEMLLPVANIHFMFNPSNHDYMSGFFLADMIKTWFRKSSNITFDVSIAHRKYFRYHNNLIGATHGDGAKHQDLPLLMAQESPEWSDTKHRYIYTHHLHHKVAKDYIGVTVETLRSPSGTDSWHHRNGYQHNPKAVEGFIHHPDHGQIARITHLF